MKEMSQKTTWIVVGLLFLVTSLTGIIQPVFASDTPILYLFWGDGCPHCEKEKDFLKDLRKQYPELEMRWFEVWDHPQFAKLADNIRKAYGVKVTSVPMTFIGDWNLVGFRSADTSGIQIIEQIEKCLQDQCKDALDVLGPNRTVAEIRGDIAKNAPADWEHFPASTEK